MTKGTEQGRCNTTYDDGCGPSASAHITRSGQNLDPGNGCVRRQLEVKVKDDESMDVVIGNRTS
jgi:hypothetical protein